MSEIKKHSCINVSFDIEQVSNQLIWSVDDKVSNPTTGRYAGGVRFFKGESLDFFVTATGDAKRFPNFQISILECTILSSPQIVSLDDPTDAVVYAPPSLFSGPDVSARPISEITDCGVEVKHGIRYVYMQKANALTVGQQNGRWELSLYITVKIVTNPGAQPILRVFTFDPESEVGNGTR
ncbi:hypothetical protein [Chitinimonas naiadis]